MSTIKICDLFTVAAAKPALSGAAWVDADDGSIGMPQLLQNCTPSGKTSLHARQSTADLPSKTFFDVSMTIEYALTNVSEPI